MSSSDGFCSTLSFAPGELGQPYSPAAPSASATSSSNSTPLPAATASPSLSKATPNTQATGNVVNNPTPTLGSVPLVTATNSSQPQPQTLPLTTPPQTPMPGVSHSATSSFSSTVLGKRDIGAASESEKEDTKAETNDDSKGSIPELEKPPKKRRIAPTLVSQEEAKQD